MTVVEEIPDFVFNLKQIDVPFAQNVSFDPYLSKFKYEKETSGQFSTENIPLALRKALFPF